MSRPNSPCTDACRASGSLARHAAIRRLADALGLGTEDDLWAAY